MRIRQIAAAALAAIAALGLSACATGLDTQVSRYQAMPAPTGQTFYVVPAKGPANLQFNRYAQMVAQQLEARGYRPAGAPQLADMLVRVDYGVDAGVREVYSDFGPFGPGYGFGPYGFRSRYYDPFWAPFYGRPFYSSWGYDPFYYGWDDPFSFGGYGGEYTEYRSHLDMDIVQRGTNAPLFEGHAKARSGTDNTDVLVPDLITAMFTGFPGRSGETVRITVPPPARR